MRVCTISSHIHVQPGSIHHHTDQLSFHEKGRKVAVLGLKEIWKIPNNERAVLGILKRYATTTGGGGVFPIQSTIK